MLRFPYKPVTGQGLGVSYSSLTQVGDIVPSHMVGQAHVEVFINVSNGNLTVFDHQLHVIEQGQDLALGFVYNSQAESNPWRLNADKRFKQLPSAGQTALLVEGDGHETTYTRGLNNWYFAPGQSEGTPYFYYDEAKQQWIWFHPHTNVTEYYDAQGLLRKRQDPQGRETTFEYDANQQLCAIVGPIPNHHRYEIRRQGTDVAIVMVAPNGEKVLQTHQFDAQGRLVATQLPNEYRMTYEYQADTTKLSGIRQTDQTEYAFNYQDNKVTTCKVGDQGNRTDISYQEGVTTLQDGTLAKTQIAFDAQARLCQVTRERGYEAPEEGTDVTHYEYHAKGQLAKIVHPNQGEQTFTYNHVFDLLTQQCKPNGQITDYHYGLTPYQSRLVCLAQYDAAQATEQQVTRRVYSSNPMLLRFEISPAGRVTEYADFKEGNPTTVRRYVAKLFGVSQLAPQLAPSLAEMEAWVASQDPQQISLTQLDYDWRGQVVKTQRFTEIDAQGRGIENETASCDFTVHNEFGCLQVAQVKQTATVHTYTLYDYDALLRLTQVQDALQQTTTHSYLDNQVATVLPNGRVEIQQLDSAGLMTSTQQVVNRQARTEFVERDTAGRAIVTRHPDGRETYSFYDRQDRLGFTVSAQGVVTQYQYDEVNRSHATIHYSKPIDVTRLRLVPGILPTAQVLQGLLQPDAANDRYSYEFLDGSGRPCYRVDAEQYVTELRYNHQDKLTAEIQYQAKLMPEQLEQLKQGKAISLPLDTKQDRCTCYFYDADGNRVAEQDPAGYITEYQRDAANRITQTSRYATPRPIDLSAKLADIAIQSRLPQVAKKVVGDSCQKLRDLNLEIPQASASGSNSSQPIYRQQNSEVKTRTSLHEADKQVKLLSPELKFGEAVNDGGCFFDALAQSLNEAQGTYQYTEKLLRQKCHGFYLANKEKVDQWNVKDKVLPLQKDEYYLIQYTAPELAQNFNNQTPIWGRPAIEGVMLCSELELPSILVVEILRDWDGQAVIGYYEASKTGYKQVSDEQEIASKLADKSIPKIAVGQKSLHFVPIIPNSYDALLLKPGCTAQTALANLGRQSSAIPQASQMQVDVVNSNKAVEASQTKTQPELEVAIAIQTGEFDEELALAKQQSLAELSLLEQAQRTVIESINQDNLAAGLLASLQLVKENDQPIGELRPQTSSEDSHTYYFYDAKGQCTVEVGPEGQVTTHDYLACGKIAKTTHYATPLPRAWLDNPTREVELPPASPEDQTITYEYDALNREIAVTTSANKKTTTDYDVMGHVIKQQTQDLLNPASIMPDCQRSHQARFDGWEQLTAETNPYLAQALTEIEADPSLTPAQKEAAKQALWENQSLRAEFNPVTGLKVKTTDVLGRVTYYYYDQDRRLVLTIGPKGRVNERVLNAFGDMEKSCHYAKSLDDAFAATLTGGYLNPTLVAAVAALKDETQDKILQFTRDRRGQVIQQVDAEGYIATYEYNAFQQCEKECLPLTAKQPSLVIEHQHDPRGLEIATRRQADGITIATAKEYQHALGKETCHIDENGNRFITQRDRAGRVKAAVNPLQITTAAYEYDGLDRTISEADALQQVTQHRYDQNQRSHTTITPDTQKTSQTNCFDETIQRTDGLGNSEHWQHEPDGQVKVYGDALGDTTETQHDLNGRKAKQILPDGREDTFNYDVFNNLTETIKDVNGLKLRTQHEYNSFNHETAKVDAKGVRTEFATDKRGLVTQTIIDPSQPEHPGLELLAAHAYNGQGAITSTLQGTKADPNQHYVLHAHDGLNRETGEIIDPATNVHPDGLMISSSKQLDNRGKPVKLIDPKGNITRLFYDELGQKRFKVDAEGGIMEWRYDANGKLSSEWVYCNKVDVVQLSDSSAISNVIALLKPTADDTGLYHFYDASQRECYTVNSRGTVTEKGYDAASHQVCTTVYSQPINPTLLPTLTTTALSQLIQLDAAQDRTSYHIVDAANQERFTIDPTGAIIEQRFDKLGRIYAEIHYAHKVSDPQALVKLPVTEIEAKLEKDPVQDRITYHVFDSLGNPLYLINPEGSVIGYRYDANNELIQECKFAKRAPMPAEYDVVAAEVKTWIPDKPLDRVIEHQRDAAGRIQQTTDALGKHDDFEFDALGQRQVHIDRMGQKWRYDYDRAKRLTKETKPETSVTLIQHEMLAARQIVEDSWYNDGDISTLVNLAIYHSLGGYEEEGSFLLAESHIDSNGKEYRVAMMPAIDTQEVAAPLDFYLDKMKQPAPDNARVDDRRDVFDEIGLLLLTQDNVNLKLLFPYNMSQLHWLTGEIRLHKQGHDYQIELYAHDPYGKGWMNGSNAKLLRATLSRRIKLLDPDAKIHCRVQRSPYEPRQHKQDKASCGVIVASDLIKCCQGQSLSQAEPHPVGAAALRQSQLALLNQHLVENDATFKSYAARHTRITNGKLTQTQTRVAVEKETYYDKVGNSERIVEAVNTADKRTFKAVYDRNNKLIGTVLEKVAIDDPQKATSLTERPEQIVDLTTQIVRNGKGLEVASCDEQGRWSFKIYDSENRLLYTITPAKTITKIERNAFGEVVKEIKYANRLNLDIRQYITTGIPREIIEDGQALTPSANDRITTYTYNQQGKLILKEQGPVFFYVPKTDGSADQGMGMVQTKYDYNTFGEVIKTAQLINPKTNEWSATLRWRNRAGEVVAECDSLGRVKRYTHNTFNEVEQRQEFAKRLTDLPAEATTIAQLDIALAAIKNEKDRTYRFSYDANGQKISEAKVGVVVQALQLDEHNKPHLVDLPPEDLTLYHEYNAVGQEIVTTHEDGSKVFTYYNECGTKIAETGVARQSWDEQDKPITLIPFTYYGVNSFGQTVTTTRFKHGTAKADAAELPTPIALDSEDQTETKLYDVRGLMISQQDAEGHVKSFTYTATRQPAREYHPLTNSEQQSPTNYTFKTHVDEKRFSYDANDNAAQLDWVRDNTIVETTQTVHNSFDEPIAEGPGDGTWPLRRDFDNTGKIWRHNANKGAYTVLLRDGRGLETASCQSAPKKLSEVEPDKLAELLNWSIEDLERTETYRDKAGRAIAISSPAYRQAADTRRDNIPLSVLASSHYSSLGDVSLSWTQPQETNVEPVFTFWPQGQKELKHVLEIKNSGNRCGVTVLDPQHDIVYASDVYDYEINYFMRNPVTGALDTKPLYQTAGSIQVDTRHNENSYNLVALVAQDNQLYLAGNTKGLQLDEKGQITVELWQGEQKLADVPVTRDPKTQRLTADLSAYPSGQYVIKTQLTHMADLETVSTRAITSLPFTIYTAKPATQPLSREIPATAKLLTLDTHGQLIWQVPDAYAKLPVKIKCVYLDNEGNEQTHEDTFSYDTDKGQYEDSEGNKLYCNTEFAHPVKQIKTLSVAIALNEQDFLPLYTDFSPIQVLQAHKALQAKQVGSEDLITTAVFTPRNMVYLTGIPGKTGKPSIQFFDTSRDRLAEWKAISCCAITREGVVFDVSEMQPGCYPFKIDKVQGQFTLAEGGYVLASHAIPEPEPVLVKPIRQTEFDNWDNPVKKIDTLGHETLQEFNVFNELCKLTQPIENVTGEDGKVTRQASVTRHGFNAQGRVIGTQDANQHTKGYVLDEAGNMAKEILPDGTVAKTQVLDGLNRCVRWKDAKGNNWTQQFDHLNQIIASTTPSKLVSRYTYNEAQARTSDVDPGNNQTRYNISVKGDIVTRFLPMGQTTHIKPDRNHQPVEQTNDDGKLSWHRDYFGNAQAHTDLSGALYNYEYDNKFQVIRESSSDGDHGSYINVDKTRDTIWITDEETGYRYGIDADFYQPTRRAVPGQDIHNVYQAGRLVEVHDKVHNKSSYYIYDTEGRRTAAMVKDQNEIIRDVKTRIDALGREEWTFDTKMLVVTGYDAVSNRRHIKSILYPGNGLDLIIQESWNRFNENDYIVIDGGKLVNGQIQIVPGQGLQLTYEGGLRHTETTQGADGRYRVITLNYDNDNRLSRQDIQPGLNHFATWGYTPTGLLKSYHEQLSFHLWDKTIDTTVSDHLLDYNANGWQITDIQRKPDTASTTGFSNFTAGGQATRQVTYYSGEGDNWDEIGNGFRRGDGLQLTTMWGYRHNKYGVSPCGITELLYDANGTLNAILGADNSQLPPAIRSYGQPVISFVTTHNGLVLRKRFIDCYRINSPSVWSKTYRMIENYHFYTVNDQYLGDYSYTQDPVRGSIFGSSIGYIRHGQGWAGHPSREIGIAKGNKIINGILYKGDSTRPLMVDVAPYARRKFQLADFIQAVSQSFPASSATKYIVAPNDTFELIAQKVFGNPNYAPLIATANNWDLNTPPLIGAQLKIPQLIPMTNQADNYRPYDQFMSIIIGQLYPHLETPQPKRSWWKELITVIVAVVVAAVAPEFLHFMLPAVFGTQGIAVAVGSAVLSSAVSQKVAIGLGIQDHFSWESIASAAITAGLANGIDLTIIKGQFINNMLKYGEIAVMEQLAKLAVGLSKEFDFSAVLSSMLSQAVNVELGNINAVNFENVFAQNLVNTAITSIAYGQEPDIGRMAGQALGTVIGTAIGSHLATAIQNYKPANQPVQHNPEAANAHQQAQQASQGRSRSPYSRDNQQAQPTSRPTKRRSTFFEQEKALANTATEVSMLDDMLSPDALMNRYLQEHPIIDFNGDGNTSRATRSYTETQNQSNKWRDFENRAMAGLEVIGGVTQVIAGVTFGVVTSETGVGLVAGGIVAQRGLDHIGTGIKGLISGKQESTQFAEIARSYGLSNRATAITEFGLDATTPESLASVIRFTGSRLLGNVGRIGQEVSTKPLGIVQEARARSAMLKEKYAHWDTVQRQARIEELAFGNRFLRKQEMPREYISQTLQSFEPGTITLRIADDSTYGLRFYGGDKSTAMSPYLNPTFPLGRVKDVNALPAHNTAEKIMQWQVQPGSPYLFGRIRAYSGRPGGGQQLYVPNYEQNLLRPGP